MKMQMVNVAQQLAKSESGEFLDLVPFNSAAVGAVKIKGLSPIWEMHPDTDELFYVLEGSLKIELLRDTGSEHHQAEAGDCFVVPKTYWHKLNALTGATFMYLTPGESLHSDKEDPRVNS